MDNKKNAQQGTANCQLPTVNYYKATRDGNLQIFFFAILLLVATTSLSATEVASSVVTCAPDFSWQQAGKVEHLAALGGKPVLLVITPSPKTWAFHYQLWELRGMYEKLAAQGMIACVAFTKQEGRIGSNIPFIPVLDGLAVGKAYGVESDFAVAVIGADGNLDCLSRRPLSGQRIHDLINASYTTQARLRRP